MHGPAAILQVQCLMKIPGGASRPVETALVASSVLQVVDLEERASMGSIRGKQGHQLNLMQKQLKGVPNSPRVFSRTRPPAQPHPPNQAFLPLWISRQGAIPNPLPIPTAVEITEGAEQAGTDVPSNSLMLLSCSGWECRNICSLSSLKANSDLEYIYIQSPIMDIGARFNY